jgi:hypothetical protein
MVARCPRAAVPIWKAALVPVVLDKTEQLPREARRLLGAHRHLELEERQSLQARILAGAMLKVVPQTPAESYQRVARESVRVAQTQGVEVPQRAGR